MHKYKWRPASRGDIGSIARFGDSDSEHESWSYGILKDVISCKSYGFMYLVAGDCHHEDVEEFLHCQIQYSAKGVTETGEDSSSEVRRLNTFVGFEPAPGTPERGVLGQD